MHGNIMTILPVSPHLLRLPANLLVPLLASAPLAQGNAVKFSPNMVTDLYGFIQYSSIPVWLVRILPGMQIK